MRLPRDVGEHHVDQLALCVGCAALRCADAEGRTPTDASNALLHVTNLCLSECRTAVVVAAAPYEDKQKPNMRRYDTKAAHGRPRTSLGNNSIASVIHDYYSQYQ